MKNPVLALICASVVVTVAGGCISHHETVYNDVSRVNVQFENDKAARVFYEALSHQHNQEQVESRTSVNIPVVFDAEHKVVSGPNIVFNRAVNDCDTNHDGTITESEAQIFASRQKK